MVVKIDVDDDKKTIKKIKEEEEEKKITQPFFPPSISPSNKGILTMKSLEISDCQLSLVKQTSILYFLLQTSLIVM